MPNYRFEVQHGRAVKSHVLPLPDYTAAHRHATRFMTEFLQDEQESRRSGSRSWRVSVRDDQGRILVQIGMADPLTARRGRWTTQL